MPNATAANAVPIADAKAHTTLSTVAAAAATVTPPADKNVSGSATVIAGGPCIPTAGTRSAKPKPKGKSKPRILLVMPLNHSQVRVHRPTQGTTTKPLPTQRTGAAPTPSITQGPSGVPSPTHEGQTTKPRSTAIKSCAVVLPPVAKEATTMPRPATAVADGRFIHATVSHSASPMPKTGAVEVRPVNRQGSQPKAVRSPSQGPVTVLRCGITQGPSGIPPPAKKGTSVIPRPATTRGPATAVTGGRVIHANVASSASPMTRTGAVEVRLVDCQGSQVQAVRPPTQGSPPMHHPTQGPTAAPRTSSAQVPPGIPPPAKKGHTIVQRPATTWGPATALAGGRNIHAAVPSSASTKTWTRARAVEVKPIAPQGSHSQAARPPIQGSSTNPHPTKATAATLPPATAQASVGVPLPSPMGPSTASTLNPAATVFVPGAKGHKTPAPLAATPAVVTSATDKKVQSPATTIAGGRRIPAIRPPSASPAPKPRAMDVRPINRTLMNRQGLRAVAKEVRPIGRQGSQAATFVQPPRQRSQPLPRPLTTQGYSFMPGPMQGYSSAPGVNPIQRYSIAPVVIPAQGYPAPPEFQPVRPVVPKGRVYPWGHLFNGETPHEQVWPRTFGPGQPHTASIIRKLQDQEFLPRPGWWCWLPFENRYDQGPFT